MIVGLAPMDGITDAAYRYVTAELFAKRNTHQDRTLGLWTEFMNVDGFLARPDKVAKQIMTIKDSSIKPVLQLYGGNFETLVACFREVEARYGQYFSGLELNVGCPSPKILACGAGSALMRDKDRLLDLLATIKQVVKLPFSLKTRIGLDEKDKESQFAFLLKAAELCASVVIHGRTLKQAHSGSVDRGFLYEVKKHVSPKAVIIGNGGLASHEELHSRLGNLDGVMVGQAAIGNPWIFVEHVPTLEERLAVIHRHFRLLAACELYFREQSLQHPEDFVLEMPTLDLLEEQKKKILEQNLDISRAVIEFRKFLFSYVKNIPDAKAFKVEMARTEEYQEVFVGLEKLFSEKNVG